MTYPTLFIPGFHGSGPAHWQSWAQSRLKGSTTLHGVDWEVPSITAWADQAHRQLAALDRPALLVAHSFGCLVAATIAAEKPAAVAGIIFVAPANPQRFAASGGLRQPGSKAATVADILPESLPATLSSVILASEDDPWLTLSAALELKERWHSHFVNLGEAGHVNVESGYGPWPTLLAHLKVLREQRTLDFRALDRHNLFNARAVQSSVGYHIPYDSRPLNIRFAL